MHTSQHQYKKELNFYEKYLIESRRRSEESDFVYLKRGPVGKHFLELKPGEGCLIFSHLQQKLMKKNRNKYRKL